MNPTLREWLTAFLLFMGIIVFCAYGLPEKAHVLSEMAR